MPGQKWRPEIFKAVKNSDVVLVCLSNKSVNKEGVIREEIEFALNIADEQPMDAIFIIPLRLEDCEVPERLCDLHWINYYEENGYDNLRKTLIYRAQTLKLNVRKKTKQPPILSSAKKEGSLFPLFNLELIWLDLG